MTGLADSEMLMRSQVVNCVSACSGLSQSLLILLGAVNGTKVHTLIKGHY